MTKLRLAVVGAGYLGRFHARLAAGLEGIELVAVIDPDREAREAVATEAHCAALAHHREVLDRVDAIVLAAPTPLHHQIGCELLRAGKHLLIEKPLASTLRQCDELVDIARRHSLTLQVGHVERFNPALTAVTPYVESPRYFEATRLGGHTFRSTDVGVVLDLMIHDLDIILSLVDSPVTRVDAVGQCVLGETEDMATAHLRFANGCCANVTASRISVESSRRMRIWSDGSYAEVDFAEHTARLVRPSSAVRAGRIDLAALDTAEREHFKEHLFDELLPCEQFDPPPVNAIEEELKGFAECIRTA
ncbi:MAG: Gfo/Idh/MocA family oxidoreductase, partial [Planctomycetes bacterium]|nr:Gfo/Idh/MocA family oxidoreductase [Planctomycetota bacterium]